MRFTAPLETATRKKVDQMLDNLGWHTDEFSKWKRTARIEISSTKDDPIKEGRLCEDNGINLAVRRFEKRNRGDNTRNANAELEFFMPEYMKNYPIEKRTK